MYMDNIPQEIQIHIISYLPMVNIIQLFKHLSQDLKNKIIYNIPPLLPMFVTNRIVHRHKGLLFKELARLHVDNANIIKRINEWTHSEITSLYQLNKMYNYICMYYQLN